MTLTKNQGYFTHRNWKSRSVGSPLLRRLLCHSYNLFLSFLISLCRTPPFLTALTIHKGLNIRILTFFSQFSPFLVQFLNVCPIVHFIDFIWIFRTFLSKSNSKSNILILNIVIRIFSFKLILNLGLGIYSFRFDLSR